MTSFSIHQRNSYRFRDKKRRGRRLQSEINVTPFVDVMLVLLVIFIIAAPQFSSTTGEPEQVALALPSSELAHNSVAQEPFLVALNAEGELFYKGEALTFEALLEILDERESQEQIILVRGDREVPYGALLTLVDQLFLEGYENLGLQTTAPPRS